MIGESNVKTTLLQLVLEAKPCLFVLCTSSNLQLSFILILHMQEKKSTVVHSVDEFIVQHVNEKI